ncbi:MAG: SDR family NAD(P)-dependent oxidoreductase, partial [Pseudomonadota bacterium]
MKSIIITGASSGIGHATAEVFLDAGWRVGLIARRADRLEALADRYETAVALPADVTDATGMQAAF